jgi:hypothetical protein
VFLGLVAGLIGGAVLGAAGGARRTSTAYDRLLAKSKAPHEVLFVTKNLPQIEAFLRRASSVDHFDRAAGMVGRRAPQQDWYSLDAFYNGSLFPETVLERGRRPNFDRADEVLTTVRTAKNAGLDIGDEVTFAAYDAAQTEDLLENPWLQPAGPRVSVKVVGIARDPTDAQLSQTIKLLYGTPAFARKYGNEAATTLVGVWLKDGPTAARHFERELSEFTDATHGTVPVDTISSRSDADANNQSARVVVAGLAIFALVAGFAGVVVIAQVLRRYLARGENEGQVLVALGAERRERTLAQIVGALPALVIAPIVAAGSAYLVSPAFPVGSARALDPTPGLYPDAVVFAGGGAAWFVLLATLTIAVAWIATRSNASRAARSRSATLLGSSEAGARALPFEVGARYALQPGTPRRSLRRATLAGLVVAIAGAVGSAVFVASLDDFTSSPDRYGIRFDLSMELPSTNSQPVLAEVAGDPNLAAVAAAHNGLVIIDGRTVDGYGVDPIKGTLDPVVRDGRAPARESEIAIGPKLLDTLGKRVGEHVRLTTATGDRELEVVGRSYSPASESANFNGEVLLTPSMIDRYGVNPLVLAIATIRPDVDHRAAFAALDKRFPYGITDESVPHPPGPVRNLDQIARLPFVLALFFAFLGAAALIHAVFMTAFERRRDIAILRSLGFTRRQGVGVLVSAATSLAFVALMIGIPLGVLTGRIGWNTVASGNFVVPLPATPLIGISVAALGLVVFAILVALIPARLSVRRTVGSTLRAE